MKRLVSSLAVLAVIVVLAPRAPAQTLNGALTSLLHGGRATIQGKWVTSHSQSGQYGSAVVKTTTGSFLTVLFPDPGSLFAYQPPAKITPIFSELMLRMLKEAKERPENAYAITIRNLYMFNMGTKTYYIAWRDTSVEMRLNQVPTHDWALVSASIGEVSGSNYYGTLVIARRPGDNRNCRLLRNNLTLTNSDGQSEYLQGLLPNWSGAGVMNVVSKMLDFDGVEVRNYFSFPGSNGVPGDRIIHYASIW
jgi:hypothetical protein